MAKLEVQIGADSSELSAEIAAAEAKIKRLGKLKIDRVKLGLDVGEITADINNAKAQLKGLNKAVNDTGASFGKLAKPVQNGGNTLMQFSRIAQDAPFGIMGIGNNITATAESFAHLSTSAGGTGNALKAVASSMMGVGGILLAVSLVTSALTYMSQNGITVGDIFDKLTGNFDANAKALKEIAVESTKGSGEQISSLKALVSVAQDKTLSDKNRLIALQKLQSEYPAYFANLTNEKILNGDLTGIINELSTALKARARASALSAKAGEAASKELDIQEKLRSTYKDIFEILKVQPKDQLQAINDLNKDNLELNNKRFSVLKTLSAFEIGKVGLLKREYTGLRGELIDVGKELNGLQSLANKDASTAIKLDVKGSKKEAAPKARESITAITSLLQPIDNEKIKKDGEKVVKLLGESVGNAVEIFKKTPIPLSIPLQPELLPETITIAEKQLMDFNDKLSSIVSNGTVNALSGIGESLGSALANGGNVIDAVGKTVLGSMGSMLKELGTATIAYGVGLIAIKAAIKNPYTAIAAGVALVAVGSAMSSAVSKSSSNAFGKGGGGGGGGGFSTGASVTSPTSSSNSNSSGGFQNVVFEISGQTLIGVLSNTLDKNRRLGGGLRLAN